MKDVPYIKTLLEFSKATENKDAVSVIDFTASWCGPCKAIAPTFTKLATLYGSQLSFFKVDVDQSPEIAQQFGIRAMPTFVALKGANKIDEVRGPTPAALEAFVQRHSSSSSGSSSSGAGPSSSSTTSSKAPLFNNKELEGFSILNGAIDFSQVTCLNESSEHTVRHLLQTGKTAAGSGRGGGFLESDVDEQLLLHIPLQQPCRLRAIRFETDSSVAATLAPKTVKLFVNRPNLGFDDAESAIEASQVFELTSDQVSGKEVVLLRFVRFQSVNSLSIFVVDNQSGGEEDVTRIDKMDLIGTLVDGTDMSQLTKVDDHDH